MFKRLYVQYHPTGVGHVTLADLINVAYRKDDGARPMPNEQIHLTVIHFGSLDAAYADLAAVNPELTRPTFDKAVESFAAACQQACPTSVTMRPLRFARYGKNKQTLVLECEATEDLERAHTICLAALKDIFTACGITEPDTFMSGHHNFKQALSLSPHITLLKNAQKQQDLQIPEDVLELQLMKIRYNGYTGIE